MVLRFGSTRSRSSAGFGQAKVGADEVQPSGGRVRRDEHRLVAGVVVTLHDQLVDALATHVWSRLTNHGWSGKVSPMRRNVKVQEAKTRLSALLADVERGEEIVIARGDIPVARLIPVQEPSERELGFVPYDVPDSFFEPLPGDEIAAWEM